MKVARHPGHFDNMNRIGTSQKAQVAGQPGHFLVPSLNYLLAYEIKR